VGCFDIIQLGGMMFVARAGSGGGETGREHWRRLHCKVSE
jgi:hypothetical protein